MWRLKNKSYDDDSKWNKMVALELISLTFLVPLPLPLRVENVKIRENSDKNQGTPYNPFLKIENIDKFAVKESAFGWVRLG